MVNQQQLQGHWDELRGGVRQRWGELTGDEIDQTRGNVEQLIGLIEQRTGQARQAIEAQLNDLIERASEIAASAAESARRTADVVRDHPSAFLASIFMVGLCLGVAIGFLRSYDY